MTMMMLGESKLVSYCKRTYHNHSYYVITCFGFIVAALRNAKRGTFGEFATKRFACMLLFFEYVLNPNIHQINI